MRFVAVIMISILASLFLEHTVQCGTGKYGIKLQDRKCGTGRYSSRPQGWKMQSKLRYSETAREMTYCSVIVCSAVLVTWCGRDLRKFVALMRISCGHLSYCTWLCGRTVRCTFVRSERDILRGDARLHLCILYSTMSLCAW